MTALQLLATEFAITVRNPDVWLSIGLALVLGGACWAFGVWVARLVGLLSVDAPAGETLGVGLAAGLMVVAAWWAAIWSGGRSSFTPVAIGFAIGIAIAAARRIRRRGTGAPSLDPAERPRPSPRRSQLLTALAGGIFVVSVGLLYGSTMAPSPRDGVQPVENRDVAFYSVLGRDLATTGTETNLSPSGFTNLAGTAAQIWYHWGELWLASAVIWLFGVAPIAARHFVVLPLVLLATAALSGTLVRRLARTSSRFAYLFGVAACLFLAPVPVVAGPFFSSWAVGMLFGIALYGLGALAASMALYHVAVLPRAANSWAFAIWVGSSTAFLLPAHLALAILAFVGIGAICVARVVRSGRSQRRLVLLPTGWPRALLACTVLSATTIVWGIATGHAVGAGGGEAAGVSPFNASWRDSVTIVALGAGLLWAVPIDWTVRDGGSRRLRDLYLGTMSLLIAGAIGWGARLGDFTMFYLFFGGIAAFATPLAAVAVRRLWLLLRGQRRPAFALGLVMLCLLQLELGVASGLARLQGFGPSEYGPIALSLLADMKRLPTTAKFAYSCRPFDEVAYGTPQLLSIDVHTGRRVIPMCFEAEFPSTLVGAPRSDQVVSQFFRGAPQMALYPTADAHPSGEEVAAFLKEHGIEFVYVDRDHAAPLVDGENVVASGGGAKLLTLP